MHFLVLCHTTAIASTDAIPFDTMIRSPLSLTKRQSARAAQPGHKNKMTYKALGKTAKSDEDALARYRDANNEYWNETRKRWE